MNTTFQNYPEDYKNIYREVRKFALYCNYHYSLIMTSGLQILWQNNPSAVHSLSDSDHSLLRKNRLIYNQSILPVSPLFLCRKEHWVGGEGDLSDVQPGWSLPSVQDSPVSAERTRTSGWGLEEGTQV